MPPNFPVPELVYRAITKPNKWLEKGKVLSLAWLRRPPNPPQRPTWEEAPSVGSPKAAAIAELERIRFVARIASADIIYVVSPFDMNNLRVVFDTETHGTVLGIPRHEGVSDEEIKAAETVTKQLASKSFPEGV